MLMNTLFFVVSSRTMLASPDVHTNGFARASIESSELLPTASEDFVESKEKKTTPRGVVFAAMIAIIFMIKFNTMKKEGWNNMNSAGSFSFASMLLFWAIGTVSLIFSWQVAPAIIAFIAGIFAAAALLFWDVLRKKTTIIFSILFYSASATYVASLFL